MSVAMRILFDEKNRRAWIDTRDARIAISVYHPIEFLTNHLGERRLRFRWELGLIETYDWVAVDENSLPEVYR